MQGDGIQVADPLPTSQSLTSGIWGSNTSAALETPAQARTRTSRPQVPRQAANGGPATHRAAPLATPSHQVFPMMIRAHVSGALPTTVPVFGAVSPLMSTGLTSHHIEHRRVCVLWVMPGVTAA